MTKIRFPWVPALILVWVASRAFGQVKVMEKAATPQPAAKPATTPAKPVPHLSPDEQTLKGVNLEFNAPALLDFFHTRTQPPPKPDRVAALLKKLQSPKEPEHNEAVAALVKVGIPAVPDLRQTANSLDEPDAAGRARKCLQAIEGTTGTAVPMAAVRLLALRKPAGATEAMLAYLPVAHDDTVVGQVENSLVQTSVRDGKVEPSLVKALEDPLPLRRKVAATVLCRLNKPEHRSAVRKLLQDPKPSVRLAAALGLATLQEAEAVPVLIDLLTELPPALRTQAEGFLSGLAGEWAFSVPQGHDESSQRLRRDLWALWWKEYDGAQVLKELQKRTLSEQEREQIVGLIHRLGDQALEVRDNAANELLARGTAAAPLLRQAANDPDIRVSQYAARCLQLIEKDTPAPLPVAAVKLLRLRKPPGAVEALLGYLPFAETPQLAGQVQAGLGDLAITNGKPDAILVQSLQDKAPVRRAAAGELLCQAGAEFRPQVRKLLQDPDAPVRLRAAIALTEAKEKEPLPVLISLIGELPGDLAWQAEEYLASVAGDKAPDVWIGYDTATRKKCRETWQTWWKANGTGLDLHQPRAGAAHAGNTLVLEGNQPNQPTGRVFELEPTGRVLWQIEGLNYPSDAQLLPGDRVLIAEANGNQVSERDLHGKILWSKALANCPPVACRRLPNGNTFIACRNRILEVTKDGKEVFTYDRPNKDQNHDIVWAQRFRGGHVAFFTNTGMYVRLDSSGQELKSFRVGQQNQYFGGATPYLLPNDHVIVPDYGPTGLRLAEYEGTGRVVQEIPLTMNVNSVERLSNGHFLIASTPNQGVYEIDGKGKTVWEFIDKAISPTGARR